MFDSIEAEVFGLRAPSHQGSYTASSISCRSKKVKERKGKWKIQRKLGEICLQGFLLEACEEEGTTCVLPAPPHYSLQVGNYYCLRL